MTDTENRLAVAERAATAGSEIAAASFRNDLDVETKSNKTDVVTEADRRSQRRVIDVIRTEFPDDAIVGEEEDALKEVPGEGDVWVVDPIDGTNNFVRGIPLWTTSVAAVRDGNTVAAANVCPALDDVYTADEDNAALNGEEITVSDRTDPETFTVCPTVWWDFDRREEYAVTVEGIVKRFGDMRRFGSAQIVLGMVASGALDGTVTNIVPNPWDTVAGAFMLRQAGGTVTDIHGDPWTTESRGLVASNGEAHDEMLAAAREAEPYYRA